jgi:hypothetical protein
MEDIAHAEEAMMAKKKEQTKTTGRAAHKKSAEYLKKGSTVSKGPRKGR